MRYILLGVFLLPFTLFAQLVIDSVVVVDVDPCTFCDEMGIVYISGGTGPYSYNWVPAGCTTPSTSAVSDTCFNMCAGTYSVIVDDLATGDSQAMVLTVSGPPPLTCGIVNPQPPSCSEVCDGSVSAPAQGGTPPYTFLWSNGDTTMFADSLCEGVHWATVTDANGCFVVDSLNLVANTGVTATVTGDSLTCASICVGSAEVTAGGGTTPYSYLWGSGCTTDTCGALCAGTQLVTVTDFNGCTAVDSIEVTTKTIKAIVTSATHNICYGFCFGSATVQIECGGTFPYWYLWPPSAGSQTAPSATGLCAGTYMVTVGDGVQMDSVLVTILEPDSIGLFISQQSNVSCFGGNDGSATVGVSGGIPPFSYSWNGSPSTTQTANNLTAGTYLGLVSDTTGCTYSIPVTITEPTALGSNFSVQDTTICGDSCLADITVMASGGVAPYSISWNNGCTTFNCMDQCAGIHDYQITDSNGCTLDSSALVPSGFNFTGSLIPQPTSSQSICDGELSVALNGGTAPYSYQWDDPNMQTGQTADSLCSGVTYCVTVTDANGCIWDTCQTMVTGIESPSMVTHALELFPNPTSGKLTIRAAELGTPIQVLDVTGRVIVSGALTDTHIDLSFLPDGVYFLKHKHWVKKVVLSRKGL